MYVCMYGHVLPLQRTRQHPSDAPPIQCQDACHSPTTLMGCFPAQGLVYAHRHEHRISLSTPHTQSWP